jgi:hypothetical protein
MKLFQSLDLPLEAIGRTVAILAQKGAGKTYTGMKLTELMLDVGGQVVALDPTGVWWGLKAEGTGPGFPILVMGGAHGDIELAPTSGAIVADFVVTSGQSVVLDLSAFNSNGEQTRFVTDFAERLFRAKHDSRTPLHLMLDEADSFAPQRPQKGEERMLGALEAIVRRGRSRGLGMTMISQRPAVLNKNVLTQADLLIALRVVGKQDHKALGEWTALHGTKEEQSAFLEALPSLPNGTAFVWSPGWLKCFISSKVLPRRTYDSSATPEPGMIVKPPKLAPVDIKALSAEIQASAEEAKANDPRELKKEIARLKRELDGKVIDPAALEKEFVRGYDKCRREVIASASLMTWNGKLSAHIPPPPAAIPTPRPSAPAKAKQPSDGAPLNAAEKRILISLFWLRFEEITPVKAAFFANYTVNGHFNNTLGKLRSRRLVAGWKITPEGEALIPSDVEDKPTGAELREWLRPKLSSAENKLLDVLMNHHGRRVAVDELAEQAGYTVNGHFNNSLGHMRTLQVAEGGAREGGVKAADVFFS